MPERAVVLEMQHITKRFPGIVANDDVSFDLREGEVHALLGENGAGKSTLMNILYGLYHPDEGEIRIKGDPVQLGSPRAAIDAGVGMVHQHFMLIPVMTVAENIVLASEPLGRGCCSTSAPPRTCRGALRAVRPRGEPAGPRPGHHGRPAAAGRDPEGALPQRGDPRARRADGRPDSAGGRELFQIIRGLTSQGTSIIFISHKLNEVAEIADRITVLRRGKLIETLPAEGATEQSLARLMVGRDVLLRVERALRSPGSRCSA